ncbi:MAG: glucoamylase [Legionella sp. 40-6]|nr:glycoside hydrolase family 15 protein [Legionella sp.]OJY34816.1 MAG: glucoamylase [Legionella sp. 40-6]
MFFLLFLYTTCTLAAVFSNDEVAQLRQNFFANFLANGAIVASPSKQDPDYYYDWVRDSAIAMDLITTWYEQSHQQKYKDYLYHYVTWTEAIQHQLPVPGHHILGEPKFYVNGQAYNGPWGRPQNDGPAIRASALIRFAQTMINEGNETYVQEHLYNNSLDHTTMGAIKTDLEYIAHHWSDPNFDLWEESYGHHFFTSMVQQKALVDGAALARRMHDNAAAAYYEYQASLISLRLHQHLNPTTHTILATLPLHSGPQKPMELDSAIILGVLRNPQSGVFAPGSLFVHNTVSALHEQFTQTFPINNQASGAILFGRYPGDTYDGYSTHGEGNPWFILTATMAEYYYSLALTTPTHQFVKVKEYIEEGDKYLELVKKYAPSMSMAEQINLHTGAQQGAYSLTWSYVSVLHALSIREKAEKILAHSKY